MPKRIVSVLEGIGADPGDPSDLALQKRVLIASSVVVSVFGLCWGLTYIAFGEPLAGAIPFGYGLLSFASLALLAATRRFGAYRTTQLALMLVLPFLLQLSLGGFWLGSAVIVWSFFAPIGALLVASRRSSAVLLVAFVVLVALGVLLQPRLRTSNNLPDVVVAAFLVLNLVGTAAVTYLTMRYFVGQKDRAFALLTAERARSERLLLNVLPGPVAERLKHREATIADRFDAVTVVFADIVDFTPLSSRLGADELVAMLNAVVSDADDTWPAATASRRSGRSATRTWPPPVSPFRVLTTRTPSWTSRWSCCGAPAGSASRAAAAR